MKKIIAFLIVVATFQGGHSQGILGVKSGTGDDLPANPSLLNWTKVHEERFLNLVDETFVHYESDFTSSTSNLSAVSGSAPSISGGNLVVGGSVKYQSTSNPIAAWFTAEMTIASMGTAGDSNKLGPMLVKDADEYIAAVYDKITARFQIIHNDTVLFSTGVVVNTTGLKIFLVMSGQTATIWFQESGEDLVCGFSLKPKFDFRTIDTSPFKYGVYCLQSGGTTTHNVSLLRGSASGGVGMFNNKIVRNDNGSEFLRDGKLVMTVDMANPSAAQFPWHDANSVVIAIDTATFAVEIIGRFYFDRSSKRLGGQDLHIIWDESQNKWLVNYVPADNIGLAESSDLYFYLDSADLFTEVVILEADLTIIGFNSGGIYYDVSTRIIEGEYKALPGKEFSAFIFSGADYDDMDLVATYSDAEHWECGQWYRFRDQWFVSYSSFGDTRQIVLSYPDLDLVGFMDLPFVMDDRIPGYDWYCKQIGGRTTYHMIGFDTQEWSTTIPNYGPVTWPWTLGRLVVWKATETRLGYEF